MINLNNTKSIAINNNYINQIEFVDGEYWEEDAPMLAPSNSWYKGTPNHNTYTSILITTNYTPTDTEDEEWNADSENAGTIKGYRIGTELILSIANGARFLYANPNSSQAFGGNSSATRWSKLTSFIGTELINTKKVVNMERMFDGLFLLENLEVGHFDTSLVTNMDMVFNNCEQLKEIDVANWDVKNVTTMYAIFADCTEITKLDLSNWDVRKVTNANSLVYDCYKLKEINLDNSDWCGVENFGMSFYRCYALQNLKLKRSGKAHSNNEVVLQAVLSYCKNLINFDATDFSIEGATDISYFFEGCSNIEYVRLRNQDFSSATSIGSFFSGCSKIKRVDLNGITTTPVNYSYNCFASISNKVEVYVGSEEEKAFVQTHLAKNATNVIFYIGDMPY